MKCEVCLELLEEYLDGELAAEAREQISAHLITCPKCCASFTALTAEQEIFSRYDRDFDVPPFLWTRIAQHTVAENKPIHTGWRERISSLISAPAFAILVIAVAVGALYFRGSNPTLSRNGTDPTQARNEQPAPDPNQPGSKNLTSDPNRDGSTDPSDARDGHSTEAWTGSVPQRDSVGSMPRPRRRVRSTTHIAQSDVLSSNLGYLDIDDRDTAKHIEQAENLLRSIRNVQVSDGDEEIDVTYDKALSRRLLNENVVLRRDAEMKAEFPTKSLLADVEPFLIDIANLPDHARPEDVRVIKERVQKTEIVAALMGYQERGPNNR